MPAGTKTLPGYRKLEPLRQGSLDRLCGLYAIINAMALAAYPVRPLQPRQCKSLFDEGIRFLAQSRRLEMFSLHGLNERPWMRLRDHLLEEFRPRDGFRLKAVPLFPGGKPHHLDNALRAIADAIDAGAPVLLILWGAYDHWTVVAGYTPSNLLLFDSWGFRWVGIQSLGLRHPRRWARHRLMWRSSSVIVV